MSHLVPSQDDPRYVLSNAMPVADERLRILAEIFDPASRDALARTGFGPGWSCWEVGAGAGTLAAWMAERSGAAGRVLATDLDHRFLDRLAHPALEVRGHDVVRDPPPPERFDLVHTRLLLCHLAEREAVLDRLISAVKPGGWLVVEDFDSLSTTADSAVSPFETPLKSQAALREFFVRSGLDLRLGRKLPGMLRARGLADVRGEGRMFMWRDGTVFSRFQRLTLEQVRDGLVREGLVTAQELERDLVAIETAFLAPSPVLWSAIGRRPWP
jgi:SAM-dependent methyltransferase